MRGVFNPEVLTKKAFFEDRHMAALLRIAKIFILFFQATFYAHLTKIDFQVMKLVLNKTNKNNGLHASHQIVLFDQYLFIINFM